MVLLLLILFVSGAAAKAIENNAKAGSRIQERIAGEIIRFHVIANSDSAKDQKLKYEVKDALVDLLTPVLSEAENIADSRAILLDSLDTIHETATDIISQSGCCYPVKVTLEDCYFPMKVYGDYVFPPGTYEALRVQIGRSEGRNWWCVMFPPLCLIDETYSIVNEDSEKDLKKILTEEEYDAISQKPIKIKFKLFELLKKLFYGE